MSNEEKIKQLEKENASMRECISSVLMRLADYDGYKGNAPGLEGLIDGAMETLSSGYPERLFNWEDREVCPLCFEVLKGDGIVLTLDNLLSMLSILNVEKLSKLVEEDYFCYMREQHLWEEKEEEKYKVLTEKLGKFLKMYEKDLKYLKEKLNIKDEPDEKTI